MLLICYLYVMCTPRQKENSRNLWSSIKEKQMNYRWWFCVKLTHEERERKKKVHESKKILIATFLSKIKTNKEESMTCFIFFFCILLSLNMKSYYSNALCRSFFVNFERRRIKCWPPVDLYLNIEKSILKNQVWWTGFSACKNQFRNWFLQATQAVKIQFV